MSVIHDLNSLHLSGELPVAPASDLKNAFKGVFQKVMVSGPVSITRNRKREAILLPADLYDQIIRELASRDPLEVFRREYDARFAAMQSDEAQGAYEDAFAASPSELGQAAVAQATDQK